MSISILQILEPLRPFAASSGPAPPPPSDVTVRFFYSVPDTDGPIYVDDVETALGDDELFEADYNPCETAAPDLSGLTFEFTATPKSGNGATITKACDVTGTTISFPLTAADKVGRLGEVFRCKLRTTNSGSAHRWAEFSAKVVD